MKQFINNFLKRPPVVMPIVALFLLIFTIIDFKEWLPLIIKGEVAAEYGLRPLLLLFYTVFWWFATFLKRWGVIAFITFSALHLAAVLFIKDNRLVERVLDNFMTHPVPLGLVFSFILLIYFRKLR